MPITADLGGKNYTLGRGRVLFDRFETNAVVTALTKGIGYRYLGNTPEFNTTSESENLDHYDSDNGIRTKDDSVQLTLDRTGSMTCDNIDGENVALFFLGTRSIVTQVGATSVAEVIEAHRGRFYQLGVTENAPSGVRNISSVVVKKGGAPTWGTTVTASGNYQVDEARGVIYILANAADIPDDTDIQITYNTANATREQVVSSSDSVYGSLKFEATNPKGPLRDYLFPYVKLAPDGDYNLKGDEWQTMGFTFEILKKSSNVAAMYIDGQSVASP